MGGGSNRVREEISPSGPNYQGESVSVVHLIRKYSNSYNLFQKICKILLDVNFIFIFTSTNFFNVMGYLRFSNQIGEVLNFPELGLYFFKLGGKLGGGRGIKPTR